MSSNEQVTPAGRTPAPDHLMDHEYDGIREYDNPTPGWWHMIFLGTIFFSVLYIAFWHFSPLAWTAQEAWSAQQAREDEKLFASGEITNDEATLARLMTNKALMSRAEGHFVKNCAVCHAADGGGTIGPNLTDDHYKNITKITQLYEVITNGAAEGAMPAWSANFSEKDRVLLAAYVASLRGTKPAAPKAAEGEVLPAWTEGGAGPLSSR